MFGSEVIRTSYLLPLLVYSLKLELHFVRSFTIRFSSFTN